MNQGQRGAVEPQGANSEVDPLLDTPVLNAVCESNNYVMGDVRQGVAERVRYNVRSRRTKDAVANRMSQNAIRPFMDALEGELSDRIRQNIKNGLDR